MHRTLPVKLSDLNSFLTCPLCKGYLIDSYTVNECLHSFCKSCILKYIKRKECCPTCQITIMKDKMNLFVKRDINLQYIVYKLVPGLFKNEMKQRRVFYAKHPKAVEFLKKRKTHDKEAVGELDEDVFFYDPHADISLSIEYSETGLSEICDSIRVKDNNPTGVKSYLQCPANFTIESLKKFLSIKNNFISTKNLDIMYDDKPLNRDLTLIDVAYLYAWRRTAPMRLFYRINTKTSNDQELTSSQQVESKTSSVLNKLDNKQSPPQLNKSPSRLIEPTVSTQDKENQMNHSLDASAQNNQNDKSEKEDSTHNNLNNTMNNSANTVNTNTNNHHEGLTITAMVASMSKETPAKSNKKPELEAQQQQQSTDLVSSSDKENEDYETKTEQVNSTPIVSNSIKPEENQINKEELAELENINKTKPIQPQQQQSQVKPKKQTNKQIKKKEALTNNNTNLNTPPTPTAKSDLTNLPKNPKQVKPKPEIAPSINPSEKTGLNEHQPANQFTAAAAFGAAAVAAAHHLPFAFNSSKTTTPPTAAAGLPSMMAPQFNQLMQMNVMSHLMNHSHSAVTSHTNPWKTFHDASAFNYAAAAAAMTNPLMNPKFNPSLLEYFQQSNKSATPFNSVQQPQQTSGNFLANSYAPHLAQTFTHLNHHHHHQYSDEFKKQFTGFNSFINNNDSHHAHYTNDFMRSYMSKTHHMNSAQQQQQQDATAQQHFSSGSSSCSDTSSLDSLKETQLRISESCNLVNESS